MNSTESAVVAMFVEMWFSLGHSSSRRGAATPRALMGWSHAGSAALTDDRLWAGRAPRLGQTRRCVTPNTPTAAAAACDAAAARQIRRYQARPRPTAADAAAGRRKLSGECVCVCVCVCVVCVATVGDPAFSCAGRDPDGGCTRARSHTRTYATKPTHPLTHPPTHSARLWVCPVHAAWQVLATRCGGRPSRGPASRPCEACTREGERGAADGARQRQVGGGRESESRRFLAAFMRRGPYFVAWDSLLCAWWRGLQVS